MALSQYTNVTVTTSNFPHEVSIMINHKNPDQIVIGSNIWYTGPDTSLSGYYFSTNGGFNWTGGVLHSNVARPSGDPVIIVDTSGYFHFLQNSNYNNGSHWWDRELIMKSTDGGRTWSDGAAIGADSGTVQDKPWGCVDLTNSPYKNSIYVTWTRFTGYLKPTSTDSSIIMFSKSANGSAYNFSEPVRISQFKGDSYDSSNTMEGAVPCVGPNGEVYVAWSGPRIRNQAYSIFFDRSTDGGNSWLDEDIIAADQPGGWYIYVLGTMRCNGFPVTGCDVSSGPYRGNIYINWSDQRNGMGDCDIWLAKSTDGGNSWSQAKRVNNDSPGRQQFFNWMSIDQVTGYIYIVFYDQRGISTIYANVYIARSTDGGETFQNVKVNTTPVYVSMWMWDYIGISAFNGKVRPVWMGSGYTVMTAIVDTFYSIGVQNISTEIPSLFGLSQNYPNPFNPQTNIEFSLPVTGNVKIVIFDLLGREIETPVNEQLKAGTYRIDWNAADHPSGVYFYKLQTEGFTETKKMILVK